MTDWPIKTIGECASPEPYSTQIGPFGKALMADEYTDSGVPVLRGVNVNRGRFHDDDFVFIGEETADRLAKFESFPDDVLLVHKGTLGEIGLMPKSRKYPRYIMGNSMLRVRCDPSKLLPEYLYYWLSSAQGQHYLFSRVSQVGVPQIQRPLSTLRQAALPVPPISVQKAITHILGRLDDKIELNRRMNETLEAMARAIFKSWFVDFDPVRTKAEGRQPSGMDAATAALFPDSFQDSALGKIPKGWKVAPLGEIAENPRRGVLPNEAPEETPYIGLEHMPRKSIALASWGFSSEVASNKFAFRQGEVLFGKLRPYFHKVGIAPLDGVCSTDILVIAPKSQEWHGILLGHLSSDEFVAYTDAASTGTKMPRTNWQDMARYEIVLPDLRISRAFSCCAKTLVEKIRQSTLEIHTLAATRDALLPKLISGELRVSDAEQHLGVQAR